MITGVAEYATAVREFDALARSRFLARAAVTPRYIELWREITAYKPDFRDLYVG